MDIAFLPKYVLLANDCEFDEGDKDGDGATDALALPPLWPAKTRDGLKLASGSSVCKAPSPMRGLRERLLT